MQKLDFEALVRFVARQQDLASEVHTCYEAGAFGYYLHRTLEALGVSKLVVQAQDWDERGKGVETDRIDALALCGRLVAVQQSQRGVELYRTVSARTPQRGKRRGGSVSKSGNPRVRAMLVEMVWRMIRWQPGYHALRKWMAVLGDATRSAAARKKAIVAVARQLAVDLWRLFTDQSTAQKRGLIHLPEAS